MIAEIIKNKSTPTKLIEIIIFNIRWFLIPFYLKLFWELLKLLYYFYTGNVTKDLMLENLEAIDIVMIANLIKMICSGSYNSFISKKHGYANENNSSGILKVKTMTSLMGICAIYLLKDFLEEEKFELMDITKQLLIFLSFILASWVLAKIDYKHVISEIKEHKNEEHH